MKKIILIIAIILSMVSVAQQNQQKVEDLGYISIVPYMANQVENIPLSARNNLQSKMTQLLTNNGIAGSVGYDTRFIITPNVSVLAKEVVASAPPKIALQLEIAFYVGDGVSGVKFGSAVVQAKGVGQNENKAYINAFKNIKSTNQNLTDLIENAKNRILNYYLENCGLILKEAETLIQQNKYEEAIYHLSKIPVISEDCYAKAQKLIKNTYDQKIENDCEVLLNIATNAWNTNQNSQGAELAALYLNKINPSSTCFSKAKSLANEIKEKIELEDNRIWDFLEKQQKYDAEIEKNRLISSKEIAIAFASNLPRTNYNIKGWW